MFFIALKMLTGDRARYLGIIIGLAFASLLITQQAALFAGFMVRSYASLTDNPLPDVWVMDPQVRFADDEKPLTDTALNRVRSIEGVAWAMPLYTGSLKARLSSGKTQDIKLIGIDDSTLIGGPPRMYEGKLTDLRESDAVIVNRADAHDKLARVLPDGSRVPLRIGDTLEINDHRAVVVGFCEVTPASFQAEPVVYTTYTRALAFAPQERKTLSFVLVKAGDGVDARQLARRIGGLPGLAAYTSDDFKQKTVDFYLKETAVPVYFGTSVLFGFLIGTVIAGQTFYNFTLNNLRYFGTLKAMGASDRRLLAMVVLQALTAGAIGYGLGVGAASLFGWFTRNSQLAFSLPWELLAASAGAIMLICAASAFISVIKVVRLEPAIVFKSWK